MGHTNKHKKIIAIIIIIIIIIILMIIVITVNLKNTKIQQSGNYVVKRTLGQIERMSAEFESPMIVIIDKTIKDIFKP